MSEQDQLGALLAERGLVTHEELHAAGEESARTGRAITRVLIDNGAVTESDLVAVIAAGIGLEFVDLADFPVDPTAVAAIPEALARRYQALPIAWEGRTLVVAMADPSNVLAIDDIKSVAKAEVRTVVSTRAAIEAAIARHDRLDSDLDAAGAEASEGFGEGDDDLDELKSLTDEAPIVKLANMIIRQAVADRASDIHIEPAEKDLRVRYRIDGVLHEAMRTPKKVQAGLVSRLKIMADLNIAEKRLPQDGRVTTKLGGKEVDLRVATLPTVYGEKIVMRILDKSRAMLNLTDLGFLPETLTRYQSVFKKPYGTILVTGPTGSGKSTTLYATLNVLNDPTKNIITTEDPVEYRLEGINQVQINNKAGLTFAAALRTILRADPDIVLVGEIRDRETATIAMEAALTGHLVLSTLHTNDASSTPTRLVEMGLEPYLVSSAVDCIVAQRLIRRLCDKCKEEYAPTQADVLALGWDIEGDQMPDTLYRSVGCNTCGKTGYTGRFALHEVLLVTDEISTAIAEHGHTEDIKKLAVAQGMLTLRQAGLAHVATGATSIEELLRVVA